MKKIASPLFQDLSEAELDTLAAARHLRTRQFAKHEVIFRAGSCVREIGIVLRGSVHIENLDLWGTKSILSSCCAACWRCPCARTSAFRSASSAQRPRLCADGC